MSEDCDGASGRREELDVWTAESTRLRGDDAVEPPHDRSITYDEVSTARGIENDPSEPRKEPDLKVPSLQMYQFQKVVVPEKKPPSLAPEEFDVFGRNIISDPERRVFHSVGLGYRNHLFKARCWGLNNRGIVPVRKVVDPVMVELAHRKTACSGPSQVTSDLSGNGGTLSLAPRREPAQCESGRALHVRRQKGFHVGLPICQPSGASEQIVRPREVLGCPALDRAGCAVAEPEPRFLRLDHIGVGETPEVELRHIVVPATHSQVRPVLKCRLSAQRRRFSRRAASARSAASAC